MFWTYSFGVQSWYWHLVFWALRGGMLHLFLVNLGWRWPEGFFFFSFSAFLGLMGLLLQAGVLMWSHQVTAL
jgi:hypothetical protein